MSLLVGARSALLKPPASVAAAANPAWQANQGKTSTGTTLTAVITTLADMAVGDTLVIAALNSTSRSISSISDGTANVYTTISASGSAPVGTDRRLTLSFCKLTNALTAGATVTITYSGTCVKAAVAQSFTSFADSPLDLQPAAEVAGTASVPQSAPGTMAQAVEMEVGFVFYESAENPVTSTFTIDAGWANGYTEAANTFGRLTIFNRLITDGTSVGATGTISVAKNWIGRIATFKGA